VQGSQQLRTNYIRNTQYVVQGDIVLEMETKPCDLGVITTSKKLDQRDNDPAMKTKVGLGLWITRQTSNVRLPPQEQ
jgi:hypothetical protein